MTKEQARNKIIKILKDHNWYGIVHDSYLGRYFYLMDLSKSKNKTLTNEIYSDIYEEFEDKYYFGNAIIRWRFDYEGRIPITWGGVLNRLIGYISHDYKLFYDVGNPREYYMIKIKALNQDEAIKKAKCKIKKFNLQAVEWVFGT